MKTVTYSTCWYQFKAKFDKNIYERWIDNMLTNVNNYNLVIYTNKSGNEILKKYIQSNIKIIIKEHINFYTYKYSNNWKKNHEKNYLLKDKVDWQVNMLWSEKINFVKETYENRYFDTEYYGWCDIGYFRNRDNDLQSKDLNNWPKHEKILNLDKNKIHYALINNNQSYITYLYELIKNKNRKGLPINEIPSGQYSIAGGFFTLHKSKISWWHKTYYDRLLLYFENDYLVKDDQILIVDCAFTYPENFQLYRENLQHYDNWFMFQRIFL